MTKIRIILGMLFLPLWLCLNGQVMDSSIMLVEKLSLQDDNGLFEISAVPLAPAVVTSENKVLMPVNDSFIGVFSTLTGKLISTHLIGSLALSNEDVGLRYNINPDSLEVFSIAEVRHSFFNNKVPWHIDAIHYYEDLGYGFVYAVNEIAFVKSGVDGTNIGAMPYIIGYKFENDSLILLKSHVAQGFQWDDQTMLSPDKRQIFMQGYDTTHLFEYVPISMLDAKLENFPNHLNNKYEVPTGYNFNGNKDPSAYYHMRGCFGKTDEKVYFSNHTQLYNFSSNTPIALNISKHFDTTVYRIYSFMMLSDNDLILHLSNRKWDGNFEIPDKLIRINLHKGAVTASLLTDIHFRYGYGLSNFGKLSSNIMFVVTETETGIDLQKYEIR